MNNKGRKSLKILNNKKIGKRLPNNIISRFIITLMSVDPGVFISLSYNYITYTKRERDITHTWGARYFPFKVPQMGNVRHITVRIIPTLRNNDKTKENLRHWQKDLLRYFWFKIKEEKKN